MRQQDSYIIELDTRDKRGGVLARVGCYTTEAEARSAWDKIPEDPDPEVQWWLVRLRDSVDDPAHADAIECKCKTEGDLPNAINPAGSVKRKYIGDPASGEYEGAPSFKTGFSSSILRR